MASRGEWNRQEKKETLDGQQRDIQKRTNENETENDWKEDVNAND